MSDDETFAQLVERIPSLNLGQPKPGHVWAIRWYPGGRKEFVEVEPTQVDSLDDALAKLSNNRRACVALKHATSVAGRGW